MQRNCIYQSQAKTLAFKSRTDGIKSNTKSNTASLISPQYDIEDSDTEISSVDNSKTISNSHRQKVMNQPLKYKSKSIPTRSCNMHTLFHKVMVHTFQLSTNIYSGPNGSQNQHRINYADYTQYSQFRSGTPTSLIQVFNIKYSHQYQYHHHNFRLHHNINRAKSNLH